MCAGISAALGQPVRGPPGWSARPGGLVALVRAAVAHRRTCAVSRGSYRLAALGGAHLARPQDRACADQDCGQSADHHRLRLQYVELAARTERQLGATRCCLNASAVLRHRTRRAPSSCARSARRCKRWAYAWSRSGTVSMAVRRSFRRRTTFRPTSCSGYGPTCACGGHRRPYRGRGRPAVHGPAFKLREPLTWGRPASKLELIDPDLGRVQVLVRRLLHFRPATAEALVVVRLERLDAAHTARDPGVLWLGWHGARPPPLASWWAWYLRRFAVDHWHRFAKQDLHWTLPHLATPEQAECWSDLMPLLTWQLWLARPLVNDVRLPWQKPQTAAHRTPGRVRQGMAGLVAAIGTPAPRPKPRGKAPGWPTGRA